MADVKTPSKPEAKPATGNGKGKADKPQETKSQKFVRLANFRVPRCLKYIADVANLANSSAYEYTPEQAEKLVKVLQDELNILKNRFANTPAKATVDKLF